MKPDSNKVAEEIWKEIEERFHLLQNCKCPNNGAADCDYCQLANNMKYFIEEKMDEYADDYLDDAMRYGYSW